MENDIRTYPLDRLEQLAKEFGQPGFRAKQLYEWLHLHHATSFDEMTNLPKACLLYTSPSPRDVEESRLASWGW